MNSISPGKSYTSTVKRVDGLTKYPYPVLELDLSEYSTDVLTIGDGVNIKGNDDIVVSVGGIVYDKESGISTAPTIDLSATGIGGLVDGITKEVSRDYLIWFFANDQNTTPSGFAATRKPYSAFSAVSSGTIGSTATYTVTNAYQFTIGARVGIANEVGTAPLYEWNWGVIASIASSTSITVDMDNSLDYGSDITGFTNGKVFQWDNFRPWVVSSSSQELYSESFRLCGELFTDLSGDITYSFRVDDPIRYADNNIVNETSTATAATFLSVGRFMPPWCKNVGIRVEVEAVSTIPSSVRIFNGAGSVVYITNAQVVGNPIESYASDVGLTSSARLKWRSIGSNASKRIWVRSYYVPGGMKL